MRPAGADFRTFAGNVLRRRKVRLRSPRGGMAGERCDHGRYLREGSCRRSRNHGNLRGARSLLPCTQIACRRAIGTRLESRMARCSLKGNGSEGFAATLSSATYSDSERDISPHPCSSQRAATRSTGQEGSRAGAIIKAHLTSLRRSSAVVASTCFAADVPPPSGSLLWERFGSGQDAGTSPLQ